MHAAGTFATAVNRLEAKDRRSLLSHPMNKPVRGRLLLALIASTTSTALLHQDSDRYYLADDFAHWLEQRTRHSPHYQQVEGAWSWISKGARAAGFFTSLG